ncbi:toprim domain-containing protein [Deferribacter thermophilus]|uniref:toprim domain-containing protein n=1 Tax=Deferribacter thermophilus TaxID=53573 RepID=UPI003C188428
MGWKVEKAKNVDPILILQMFEHVYMQKGGRLFTRFRDNDKNPSTNIYFSGRHGKFLWHDFGTGMTYDNIQAVQYLAKYLYDVDLSGKEAIDLLLELIKNPDLKFLNKYDYDVKNKNTKYSNRYIDNNNSNIMSLTTYKNNKNTFVFKIIEEKKDQKAYNKCLNYLIKTRFLDIDLVKNSSIRFFKETKRNLLGVGVQNFHNKNIRFINSLRYRFVNEGRQDLYVVYKDQRVKKIYIAESFIDALSIKNIKQLGRDDNNSAYISISSKTNKKAIRELAEKFANRDIEFVFALDIDAEKETQEYIQIFQKYNIKSKSISFLLQQHKVKDFNEYLQKLVKQQQVTKNRGVKNEKYSVPTIAKR